MPARGAAPNDRGGLMRSTIIFCSSAILFFGCSSGGGGDDGGTDANAQSDSHAGMDSGTPVDSGGMDASSGDTGADAQSISPATIPRVVTPPPQLPFSTTANV